MGFPLFKRRESDGSTGGPEFIICGLGNPGKKYDKTRHNVGFMVVDLLAQKFNVRVDRLKFEGVHGTFDVNGHRVMLLKPQTFMNLSGRSVADAAAFYKIPLDRVIVVYDDVSLPPGKIRLRPKGSDGGHNGIKNIIYLCNTDVFPRIKIGVGLPPHKDYDLADWVLSSFGEDEQKVMADALNCACDAAIDIITLGFDAARSKER